MYLVKVKRLLSRCGYLFSGEVLSKDIVVLRFTVWGVEGSPLGFTRVGGVSGVSSSDMREIRKCVLNAAGVLLESNKVDIQVWCGVNEVSLYGRFMDVVRRLYDFIFRSG